MAISTMIVHPEHYIPFDGVLIAISQIESIKLREHPRTRMTLTLRSGHHYSCSDQMCIDGFKDHMDEYLKVTGGHIHWDDL